MTPRPPAVGRAILRLLPSPHRDFVTGDLTEEYVDTVLPERGRLRADSWFVGQSVRSVWSFARYRGGPSRSERVARPSAREVRYAFRGLMRRPGHSALAVVTLAVGIGTATSVFSVTDAVLLRDVPGVEGQEALATVSFSHPRTGGESPISLPNLRDLGEASPAVAEIAGFTRALFQLSIEGLPARSGWSQIVTGGYFEMLGVAASQGRLFTREEAESMDGAPLAVVSDAFWRGTLQRDPEVVGRSLRINGLPFTIVGVMQPDFRGIERLDSLDLWVPASQHVALRHGQGIPGWELEGRGAAHFANTIIRIDEGAQIDDTEEQLQAAMTNLVEAYPDHNERYAEAVPTVDAGIGISASDRSRLAPTLQVLAGLVVMILLVTCANVANLLVLRALQRRDETVLRRALGAARAHLFFQNLAEALILALPAVLLGLMIAVGVNGVMWSSGLFPTGVATHTTIDARVFAFAAALGILTACTFGLLPALLHRDAHQHRAVQAARRASSRSATLLQGGLSVVQLALSLALVGSVLLLARTSSNLTSVDPGFVSEGVVAIEVDPGPQGYRGEEVSDFRAALVDRVGSIDGVEAVAASGFPPFGHIAMQLEVREPSDPSQMLTSRADWVTGSFFDAIGIGISHGRPFTLEESTIDAEGRTAVVLSRSLAERLFGAPERAVNQSLDVAVFGQPMEAFVVGVTADIIDANLRREPHPKMYVAMPGSPQSFTTLLVRTQRPTQALAAEVRSAVEEIDSNIPLGSVAELEDLVANATVRERTFARLSALLAAIALLLAGVGLYSVVAYAAAQRRREFGIRLAVGASSVGITRLVLRHSLVFGALGVGLGVAVFLAGSRLLAGIVFGVASTDPLTLAGAATLLLMVTVAASLAPALSATRVDPAVTLRSE